MSFEKPVSPEEAKYTVLQFLGQNLGDLKDLDTRIINKTPSLRGLNIDAKQIVDSVAPPSPVAASINNNSQQIPNNNVVQRTPPVQHFTAAPLDTKILEKIYDVLCDIKLSLDKKK